jgi:hypothetical protein
MKAIKTSIWYEEMIEVMKSALIHAWFDIHEQNNVKYTREKRIEFENQLNQFFNSFDFVMHEIPSIENIISQMVDERLDHKSEMIDLWKQIAINTSAKNECWHMAVENADNVLKAYQEKFTQEN